MREFRSKEGSSRDRDGKDKGKGAQKRRPAARKRSCRLCADSKILVDYKDARLLQQFLSERGRVVPRRVSGNCAIHQRAVGLAIKRARILAFIPFTSMQHS